MAIPGCGRVVNYISFADQLSSQMVGIVREYAIMGRYQQALASSGAPTVSPTASPLSSSIIPTPLYSLNAYRIPFLVAVTGSVTGPGGVGSVAGVDITLCHIDPMTGFQDANPSYCPLITFTSDKLGHFEGEVRVSDIKWNRLTEMFNVTASYTLSVCRCSCNDDKWCWSRDC